MEIGEQKLKLIAKGSNSQIYVCGDKGRHVALKVVNNSKSKQAGHLKNQYRILSKLKHQNIIGCLQFRQNIYLEGIGGEKQQNSKTESSVLVLEYANQGCLLDFIRKNSLDITKVRHMFQSICQTVEYLHCNYIVHRDLKLENILLKSENGSVKIKIADFGFGSHYYEDGKIKFFNEFRGTKRGYMAPQIHQTISNPEKYYDARKTDIFALGVILFVLVMGKLPFQNTTKDNRIYKLIKEQEYQQFWNRHILQLSKLQIKDYSMFKDFQDLFICMVCYSPSKRITIEEVLQHSWMEGKQTTLQSW